MSTEALSRLSTSDLLGLVATGQVSWRTGCCAACGHEYRSSERHAMSGMWIFNEGTALYTLCSRCTPRARKPKFRERIRSHAFRSLFRAGPDDVKGNA